MSLVNARTSIYLGKRYKYCMSVVAIIAIIVASLSCKPEVKPSSPEPEGGKLQQSIAAQKRINSYFLSAVMPKLKTCWDRVQGKGTIEMKYRYENDKRGGWAFKTLEVGKSGLPKGENAKALACMQDAVKGTSFPREGSETHESYLIDWEWPVPLPPDAEQQMERMIGTNGGGGGGGGCDGHGAEAKCVSCSDKAECLTVCVGEEPPCHIIEYPGQWKTCSCVNDCASGGPFGFVGGMVMY
jgi:hypothetical protein